ncbi:metal ABC transporter ATP-binding protein [Amnibacterium sp. CER49]|uniref:metal ABC transporter ATP-binding protein n=1 Tax=Amnibacterium sp. CER49 TaxID=3039161 RepID=UPI002449B50A|nr:metal ABC transporter ATP-binding protein [Amnibacterium sp. CER49]MDH2443656.1 metal ABC transporter ATP-binding protein [Amnibacterium sp. CER49]
MSAAPVVSFRKAALAFDGRVLWRDLDLDVAAGEFVAVLGPNGSGKTTFLRAVLGLQPLSAGTLAVLGRPPRRGDRRIGYVPQQRLLDESTPVRGVDLVGFGVSGGRFGLPLPSRGDRARVASLVEAVGAEAFAGRSAALLSGGEQQRLRVGQAIADDPPLLLCDEPLISLDLANQAVVSGLLDRHRRERDAAVLMVTHDVNPVLPMVDRVVYLVDGRFRIGPPREVLTSEVLSDLYRTHVDVIRVHDRIVVVGAGSGHEEHEHVGRGRG